jgi:hypothetical protein
MELTQQVRDYAASHGLAAGDAIQSGMDEVERIPPGAWIYLPIANT